MRAALAAIVMTSALGCASTPDPAPVQPPAAVLPASPAPASPPAPAAPPAQAAPPAPAAPPTSAAPPSAPAPAATAPATADAAAAELPEGRGKQILLASCTACHDLREVTKFRGFYTRAQWRDIVMTMVDYGADVGKADVEVLTGYLDEHLGKRVTASKP